MNEFSKIEQGEILNGKYKIISLIAEGGMGKTYKGIELSSGKEVALKILHFSRLDDWKILELFEREVVLLKNIDHPNIPDYVDNFEIDKSGDRLYVLVQEYVEGDNLQAIAESGKRFSVELVMKIFKELLKILTYIHTLQPPVIHRDINPKNIVIGKEGKIYLVDFGAAGQVAKSTFAASGTFVGTIGYMAQEQLYGKTLPATDLYSLGVTIAFLLTGREPSDFALIDMKLDYKPYAEAPEFLTDAIDAIIEPDLNKRTSSAKEVLRILDKKVLRRPDVISVSYGNKNQKISSSSKKVLKTIIAFSVVSLIISGIISLVKGLQRRPHSRHPALMLHQVRLTLQGELKPHLTNSHALSSPNRGNMQQVPETTMLFVFGMQKAEICLKNLKDTEGIYP
jgi:serine/threonine protein kinase